MSEFNYKNDLVLKKWVLGIAAMVLAIYMIDIWFEDEFMKVEGKAIQQSAKEQQSELDNFKQKNNAELARIQNGMRSIAEDIKKGSESMDKNFEKMQKQFAEDKKMIDERTKSFARDWEEQDKLAEKMMHETDERWKKERKEEMETWNREDEKREKARVRKLIASYQSSIKCEKRVFGSSSFDTQNPYFYNQQGIEDKFEQCKDLRKKRVSS